MFQNTIETALADHCCSVEPNQVIFANKDAKMRELDRQILGLFITRAAISDVPEETLSNEAVAGRVSARYGTTNLQRPASTYGQHLSMP
jgi:hypothetical protein